MKVYVLTNAWSTDDTIVDGICYGVFTTHEKAMAGMKAAVKETKENWVESDLVEDEDEIGINEEEDSCSLESCEGDNFEIFKIEEIEVDEVSNG